MAIVIAIGLAVLLIVLAFVGGRFSSRPNGRSDPAYATHLSVTANRVLEADTMMAGSVIYVEGRVSNNGSLPVTVLSAELRFFDPYGQVVQVEHKTLIDQGTGQLRPGSYHDFRLGFDHISSAWNQAPPQVRITSVAVK